MCLYDKCHYCYWRFNRDRSVEIIVSPAWTPFWFEILTLVCRCRTISLSLVSVDRQRLWFSSAYVLNATSIVVDFLLMWEPALFKLFFIVLHPAILLPALLNSESRILLAWLPLIRKPSEMESIKSWFCRSFDMPIMQYVIFYPNLCDCHWQFSLELSESSDWSIPLIHLPMDNKAYFSCAPLHNNLSIHKLLY